jgi:hypothetical protein
MVFSLLDATVGVVEHALTVIAVDEVMEDPTRFPECLIPFALEEHPLAAAPPTVELQVPEDLKEHHTSP